MNLLSCCAVWKLENSLVKKMFSRLFASAAARNDCPMDWTCSKNISVLDALLQDARERSPNASRIERENMLQFIHELSVIMPNEIRIEQLKRLWDARVEFETLFPTLR